MFFIIVLAWNLLCLKWIINIKGKRIVGKDEKIPAILDGTYFGKLEIIKNIEIVKSDLKNISLIEVLIFLSIAKFSFFAKYIVAINIKVITITGVKSTCGGIFDKINAISKYEIKEINKDKNISNFPL